jgi:hypothetical protein
MTAKLLTIALVAIAASSAMVFTSPRSASAEPGFYADCGEECVSCGIGRWKTRTPILSVESKIWKDVCAIDSCRICGPELAAQTTLPRVEAPDLLKRLRYAKPAEIARIVAENKGRLLISTKRGLVAVKGDLACNSETVVAMGFMPEARAQQIAEAGVGSLAEYLQKGNGALLAAK